MLQFDNTYFIARYFMVNDYLYLFLRTWFIIMLAFVVCLKKNKTWCQPGALSRNSLGS